ncbi:MAG: alpha-L-rhamnosidase [Spirochaetaceae bacterium]|nr:MAG: alpha-L-rhamnosidase [Spirochaetaceae bacterium]
MDLAAVRARYDDALAGLSGNVTRVYGYDHPVLIEGGSYVGIWLECGPLEGLVYGRIDPAIARANHDVFFHHQRADGYLPCYVWRERLGTAQIQMVVPIAATALETADLLQDEAFLANAYQACARWDDWLSRNRNTRGTGLCELFCQFDSGHDGSPRHAGLPEECPDGDAAICPDAGRLPYLAPDLSASVYGGRVALASMARRLGKPDETLMWQEKAETTRRLILEHCYDPDDECFYDVDADGRFVRIRGDLLTRVFGEHVVDQALFDRIYARHIKDPAAFWTPYPLPSIAANDPAFVRDLPRNSWGGASQALTALRAPRWFEHYGKSDDLRHLMTRWVEAIARAPAFMQQMSPWTGEFSTSAGYSPSMCVMIDFAERLGVAGRSSKEGAPC